MHLVSIVARDDQGRRYEMQAPVFRSSLTVYFAQLLASSNPPWTVYLPSARDLMPQPESGSGGEGDHTCDNGWLRIGDRSWIACTACHPERAGQGRSEPPETVEAHYGTGQKTAPVPADEVRGILKGRERQ